MTYGRFKLLVYAGWGASVGLLAGIATMGQ